MLLPHFFAPDVVERFDIGDVSTDEVSPKLLLPALVGALAAGLGELALTACPLEP